MNILIVGSTGQIGEAILREVLKTNHNVSVLVRKSPVNFPHRIRAIEAADFDRTAFRRALNSVDHIIYCLGKPEQFVFNRAIFERTNVDILRTFIEEMIAAGKKSLTYTSTYEIFKDHEGAIEESAPVASGSYFSDYFRSMIEAYKTAKELCEANSVSLTTIHPSAVYGGLNTGDGITNYMENIALRRFLKTPFIFDGDFPVIHAESLADGVMRSIGKPGAYLLSDCMTSLGEIARIMKRYANCSVPVTMPLSVVKAGTALLEMAARIGRFHPIISGVQIDYITKGHIPKTDKAERELGWLPMPLAEGIRKYLRERLKIAFPKEVDKGQVS